MTLHSDTILGIGCSQSSDCASFDGCPEGIRPDFCIKRNDTSPSFKISVEDCDGVVEFGENYILEVNIWAKAKLKKSIDDSETEIIFADNIGFNQIKENDVILVNRARNPEKMLITGFNEEEKKVIVSRGYDSTPQNWPKGSDLTIFRAINVEGTIESVYEDFEKVDGTTETQLVQTFLVYKFTEETSSLAGCYWLEFKLTELDENSDVVSTKRFPLEGEGFLIKITNSPTES